MRDDRDTRIAEAHAALRAAAEAGIDIAAQARFVARTTPAERIQRADVSPGGLAEAEDMAYRMDSLRRALTIGTEQARGGKTRDAADVFSDIRGRRG